MAYIVGICGGSYGKPGPGRTTAADALVSRLGFTRLSTLDVVRTVSRSTGAKDCTTVEEVDAVCRAGRRISENFWLNLAVKAMAGRERLVLDDVWFGNEARFIKDNGGLVIMVSRPGTPNDDDLEFTPDVTIINSFASPGELGDTVVGAVLMLFPELAAAPGCIMAQEGK